MTAARSRPCRPTAPRSRTAPGRAVDMTCTERAMRTTCSARWTGPASSSALSSRQRRRRTHRARDALREAGGALRDRLQHDDGHGGALALDADRLEAGLAFLAQHGPG